MNERLVFFLHPNHRAEVDAVMADPNPQGGAAMLRALLNNADVHYMDTLPSIAPKISTPGIFESTPFEALRKIAQRGAC